MVELSLVFFTFAATAPRAFLMFDDRWPCAAEHAFEIARPSISAATKLGAPNGSDADFAPYAASYLFRYVLLMAVMLGPKNETYAPVVWKSGLTLPSGAMICPGYPSVGRSWANTCESPASCVGA